MNTIYNFFRLAIKEPFGCLVSLTFSAILISSVLAGAIYIAYMMFSVSLIKGIITSSTGFSVSAQNIYVNVFTGNCEIDGLTLLNPSVYELDRRMATRPDNIDKFIHAKKIKLEISPLELITGKFVISSLNADITFLNCVRINDSTNNLVEFIAGMKKSISIKNEDGRPFLKEISIKISRAAYSDYATGFNNISWGASDLSFKKTNIENIGKLLIDMKEIFEASNARFISNALNVIEIEKQ